MELCFNEMTVMKNGTLPEDIALCAQAGGAAADAGGAARPRGESERA